MSIWHRQPDLEELHSTRKNTITDLLDIRFESFDDSSITASMPVDARTHQPYGLLHGGASVVLAETLGSMASYHCIDTSKFYCVGLEVNANHLRGLRSGRVTRGMPAGASGAFDPCMGHSPERRGRQAELHFPADRCYRAAGQGRLTELIGGGRTMRPADWPECPSFGRAMAIAACRGLPDNEGSVCPAPSVHVATYLFRSCQRLPLGDLSQAVRGPCAGIPGRAHGSART